MKRSDSGVLHLARLLAIAVVAATATTSGALDVGQRAKLSFKALDGTVVNAGSLAGKLVVVDFWAEWCGPCMAAMPHMVELHKKYAARGVQIIGINMDPDRATALRAVKENGLSWPHYFDGRGWDNRYALVWEVDDIPHIFILSPDRRVLWRGPPDFLDEALERALKSNPPRAGGAKLNPKVRAAAIKALHDARRALDEADYAKMLEFVGQVPPPALTDPAVIGNARILVSKLRLKADETAALEEARTANPQAAAHFAGMLRATAPKQRPTGQPFAAAGSDPQAQLVKKKLGQAKTADTLGEHFRAFRTYQWLIDRAGDTDAGAVAAQRIAEYEADPEVIADIRAKLAEEQARSMLTMARNYAVAGKNDLARKTYQKIIADFPKARCCDEASKALKTLE